MEEFQDIIWILLLAVVVFNGLISPLRQKKGLRKNENKLPEELSELPVLELERDPYEAEILSEKPITGHSLSDCEPLYVENNVENAAKDTIMQEESVGVHTSAYEPVKNKHDIDVRKMIIYSEILRPKYSDEKF